MSLKLPCRICKTEVGINDKAIYCNIIWQMESH